MQRANVLSAAVEPISDTVQSGSLPDGKLNVIEFGMTELLVECVDVAAGHAPGERSAVPRRLGVPGLGKPDLHDHADLRSVGERAAERVPASGMVIDRGRGSRRAHRQRRGRDTVQDRPHAAALLLVLRRPAGAGST